jgi:hypothetical protein
VGLHVVDADGRNAQGEGQAAADAAADQQRADQARSGGVGDAVELPQVDTGVGQQRPQQGDGAAQVVARGQFRYHAAVLRVQRHLTVQGVAEQAAPAVVQAETGFVAGTFDAQNQHGAARKLR